MALHKITTLIVANAVLSLTLYLFYALWSDMKGPEFCTHFLTVFCCLVRNEEASNTARTVWSILLGAVSDVHYFGMFLLRMNSLYCMFQYFCRE